MTLIRHRDRWMAYPEGARDRILVETDLGWVLVRRDLDLDRPRRQLGFFLPIAAFGLILVAAAIASAATRPLATAQEGMDRIAAGDLDHRLAEEGPEEIVRVAAAFNRMADRIDGLLRTERELMAGLSHELRTPLTRLRLEIEMLRDGGVPAKRVDAMEADVVQVDGLIGELLHLSRLQLGEHGLARKPVDLLDVARRAASALPLPAHTLGIEGSGGVVQGDEVLLQRVVVNLIQNAGRYAPAGSRIAVTVDGARIVVEDEGPGVPPEEIPHLFDPFWRGGSGKAKASGGLGLGLMLVRQVVLLHGGTVRAENRPSGGLRVIAELAPGTHPQG